MDEQKRYPGHALAALIIGLSLIIGTLVVAGSFYKVKALSRSLSVTGSAERSIKSDTVKWRARVMRTVNGDNPAEGSKLLQQDFKAVLDYLSQKGIPGDAITVMSMDVTATCGGMNQYYGEKGGCGSNPVVGYALDQGFTVESGEVDKVTAVARDAAAALLEKGIVFSSEPLEYYYGKLADLKLDMLSEATKDAQNRADRIAAATGAKLGSVQSASMGVFQITAVNSTEISDYGAYDTTTIDKKVTAVVRAAFALP